MNLNKYLKYLISATFLLTFGSSYAQTKHFVGFNLVNYSDFGHNSYDGFSPRLWITSGFTYQMQMEKVRWKSSINYEGELNRGGPRFATRRTVLIENLRYSGFNVRTGLHNPYKDQKWQFTYGADLVYRGGRGNPPTRFTWGYYAAQALLSPAIGVKLQINKIISVEATTAVYAGFQLQDYDGDWTQQLDNSFRPTINYDPLQQLTLNVRLK